MYDLHLTAEQIEMRDTVRDFVEKEIKPAALHPSRLEPFEKPLLADLLGKASQMGLRTLALAEEAGGAGADCMTSCIVMEELAAGEVDIAVALGHTAALAPFVFGRMSVAQHTRFFAKFAGDDGFHLAFAGRDPYAGLGWSYHRPLAADEAPELSAVKQGNGDWLINGTLSFVANAPIAQLFVAQARTDPKKTGANGLSAFIVLRGTPGLTVGNPPQAVGGARADGEPVSRWYHGTGATVAFKDCRVAADSLLGKEGKGAFGGAGALRGYVQTAAINLGVGRAAYEAAVDYAKLRRQGGRSIIEHQAIGTKLADCAIKLEIARTMIWKAAWALDHPAAVADRSVSDLPLHVIARVYTAEAVNDVALLAAECFGAMGVMRDMPLQKYVHDSMVFLHSEDSDGAAKLAIAEAVAGYQRPMAA
jgi:alkylation response protein AidB-like acyl-CoA dehydrogenase